MRTVHLGLVAAILSLTAACSSSSNSGPEADALLDVAHDKTAEVGPDVAADDAPVGETVSPVSDLLAELASNDFVDLVADSDPEIDAQAEEMVAPTCLNPPPTGQFTSDASIVVPQQQGVDQSELASFHVLSDAALSGGKALLVTTWLADEDTYMIKFDGGHVKFKRIFNGSEFTYEVIEQLPGSPLSCTDPAAYNSYESELAAYENPMDTTYEDLGYEADDPRVGFIPSDKHCYPGMFQRIAQLYDAPNAPDFHVSATPYGWGSGGSHGALDVLQSRGPLVFSGAGIKKQFDASTVVRSVDIAPTVLHLMGAVPEPGIKQGVPHDSVYLKWQDGEPQTSMLEEGCVQPYNYVIIILFDGLQSNELVHLYESGEFELPSFTQIMDNGTIFRNGALQGFPSVSVPGHLTVGTGLDNGHHYFVGNGFYYREEEKILSPGDIMAKADEFAAEPEKALELFDEIMNPGAETIFEAAHRHFGEDFFCASINELTLRGADYNLVDLARALGPRIDYYDLADTMAIPQVTDLLGKNFEAGPMLFYLSFYGTDKVGEHVGPHGQELREKMFWLDGQIAPLLSKLDELGIADETLIILTADHGMELQDKNQPGSWAAAMQATEIPYLDPDGFGFVYLL